MHWKIKHIEHEPARQTVEVILKREKLTEVNIQDIIEFIESDGYVSYKIKCGNTEFIVNEDGKEIGFKFKF